jgi:hypothetical protein
VKKFSLLVVPLLKKKWNWRLRRENGARKMRKTLLLLRLLGSPRDWPNPIEVNSFIIHIAYIENDHHAPPFFSFFFPFLSGFLLEVTINYTSSALAHLRMISILQKKN